MYNMALCVEVCVCAPAICAHPSIEQINNSVDSTFNKNN